MNIDPVQTIISALAETRKLQQPLAGESNMQALQCLMILREYAALDLGCDGCPVA
jgi:hypothetical protein